MKKYLVWKSGGAPTAGVVVKAYSSFEARQFVARRRNADSVANGLGFIFSADEFCARLVPDADEVAPVKPPGQIKRCWINQPSTRDPLHQYHGRNVLAAYGHEGYEVVLYFTEGPATSVAGTFAKCLSDGWCAQDIAPSSGSYLTAADADKLRHLVLEHVKAETERSWAGSQPVEDRAQINAEANDANTAYKRFVLTLEGK